MIDLRLGRWQDTMSDIECDALITDPPYSARTHEGQRSSGTSDEYGSIRRALDYECVDEDYARAFVASWLPRVRYWWVLFGYDYSCAFWRAAMLDAGLLTFATVPWVKQDAAPRFTGDGPASQAEHIAIGRTRGLWATQPPWGSLPGWYMCNTVLGSYGVVGAKPESLMRALVRDYSRPGWVLADPHAGSGTTLVAARAEGRSCIGSEMDPKTYAIAKRRIEQPYARDLFVKESA